MSRSRTAEYVALYRALETTEVARAPLFRDPFAQLFLSHGLSPVARLARISPLRKVVQRYADWRAPGARTSAIGRTRFIDDAVRGAVARGARQVVILGAGYDCRAHRLSELRDVQVFEVDRLETQATKRQHLQSGQHLGARADIHYVAADLCDDDLGAKLAAAGWDRTLVSVFVWEGVTAYLPEAAVTKILAFIGGTAPGTQLVFTYIHRGVIDGTTRFDGADIIVRNVKRLGEPWIFGLHPDDAHNYLARFGLVLDEDLGADAYRRRYLGDDALEFRGYAFYRVAVAHAK